MLGCAASRDGSRSGELDAVVGVCIGGRRIGGRSGGAGDAARGGVFERRDAVAGHAEPEPSGLVCPRQPGLDPRLTAQV